MLGLQDKVSLGVPYSSSLLAFCCGCCRVWQGVQSAVAGSTRCSESELHHARCCLCCLLHAREFVCGWLSGLHF